MRAAIVVVLLTITAVVLPAQRGPGGPGGPPPGGGSHAPMQRPRAAGKWWTSPLWIRRLNLTADQQRRLEDTFQQHRLKLIDLGAALEKQEAMLDPLLDADHPEETRVLAQVDRIADARADLEKTNARMLWGFRTILTPEQWKDLQSKELQNRGPQNNDHPPPPRRP